MGQPTFSAALDTPKTNVGDATFLHRAPDFADISQEASFQSPAKDGYLAPHLRKGLDLRTPRPRGPFADRRNLPASVGGAEFTPMLKSATRNSARRRGKENGGGIPNTPALSRIEEDDMTPVPRMDTSVYPNHSYVDNTLPQLDSSSVASTPMAFQPRRSDDKGPLQDGNQLSLREQENVIDRIEKENFGLKLKIHFLEDALRKAGPGFSEAALKENTELKVDKVTMQRELHRYKKHLTSAERDLETYRQQMLELQDKAQRKSGNEDEAIELDRLQKTLQERDADIDELQRQLDQSQHDQDDAERFKDNIEDLEAEVREKDRLITERDDELDDLRERLADAEAKADDFQRRMDELEQTDQQTGALEQAKETIEYLEQNIRRLEEELDQVKEKSEDAVSERERAEKDLEELQEEMANKSVVTKGLSRQIDEKVVRLQDELNASAKEYAMLEKELARTNEENAQLQSMVKEMRQERNHAEQVTESDNVRASKLEAELLRVADERDSLQSRHDTLAKKSESLEDEVARLERELEDVEQSLSQERELALTAEKDLRNQYQNEIERLMEEVSNLQAEIQEKDNLYDNDSEKWENDKHALTSERERAEKKVRGLERTIDRLREAAGSLSDKESKVKEAVESEMARHKSEESVMTRQIDDLQEALEMRQALLTSLRNDLSTARDELRQTQVDYQVQANKVMSLEDELALLQSQRSGNANQELAAAKHERDELRHQLEQMIDAARDEPLDNGSRPLTELKFRQEKQPLAEASRLEKVAEDNRSLRDQLAKLASELRSTGTSLAEARAERDELDGQLRRAGSHDDDRPQVDQERLDLRTAKMKLDIEVRRLKNENKALLEQGAALEKTLEDEMERATSEEDRIGRELLQLQARMRQASSLSSHDLGEARRTIRELERRLEDLQGQLAIAPGTNDGHDDAELSMIRKELSASRQRELEFLRQDAAHRDVVEDLKGQIANLERRLLDEQVHQPPSPVTLGHRSVGDLERRLSDLEDQKVVLEEVLVDARQQAEEMTAQHEQTVRHLKHKVRKAEKERKAVAASRAADDQQGCHLREKQVEIENLEHDIHRQQELIDGLVMSEAALRRKLERARNDRAAYRMTAEKLQRDISHLKPWAPPSAASDRAALVKYGETDEVVGTVVRAAEGVEERHKKEIRGMVMQMEWMQARWEREVSLRSDAAFAKNFVQLQLNVANACNKAQLRELEHIRTGILQSRKPLAIATSTSLDLKANGTDGRTVTSIRPFLIAARFVARMAISARGWAKQEAVRRELVKVAEEQRRVKRSKRLRVVRTTGSEC
ncbi:hypothetical protein RJ55_01927 [Drechmeria coniospora]|nr:hypothetical protein RJ55_01927 [Drechmeria coniospora]